MKRTLGIIALLAAVAASHGQTTADKSNPGSLYRQGTQNPLLDRVARKVGDIVTILIDESSIASFSASTQTTKADSNSINVNLFNDFLNRLFKPFTTGDNSSNSGTGTTNHTGSMKSTMSAVVREVMPNGNLVIEGNRSLVTNKQTQTFVLSGIIRPFDITPQNTIPSSKIAEAEIKMAGAGSIQDRQRKGILTQLLDWIF